MHIPYLNFADVIKSISWQEAVNAIKQIHFLEKPQMQDISLSLHNNELLTRAAWLENIGVGVKSEVIFPLNPHKFNLPSASGVMLVFHPLNGKLRAIMQSSAITVLKTVADSLLGAELLAKRKRKLLIVGAGQMAHYVAQGYSNFFSQITEIQIWARRIEQAQNLVAKLQNLNVFVNVADDLKIALSKADIVSSATAAKNPIISGKVLKKGVHLDLIGAFTPNMREADDCVMQRAILYVDNLDTTKHVGEIAIPVAKKLVNVSGDLYDLSKNISIEFNAQRDITVYKNGGGAHFDLAIADLVLKKCNL